jgi:chromosome segregation ATPase
MNYIILVVAALLAVAGPIIGYMLGRRLGFQASDDQAAQLREESGQLEAKLVETLSNVDVFASKAQLAFIKSQSETFQQAIREQQAALNTLVERVDKTRVDVQTRENDLQELRAVSEEDQVAITQSLASYSESSAESLSLEQKLAESLRTVDAMANEIQMTTDQQAVFSELSNALTQASAQLRDVIIDYQNANERLSSLHSRFTDLENEYSKLVEEQLAG